MNTVQTAIAEAITLAPQTLGEPLPGNDGATVSMIDIETTESLTAKLAAHRRGERGPVYLLCIPKYAPQGTEGWVYTLEKVNKVTVSLAPVGGGRGLKIEPIALAEADADDLRAYAQLRTEAVTEVRTGDVVQLAADGWNQPDAALWVVIGLTGMTKIEVARLGGDNGRSWPGLPRTMVTRVVTPAELPAAVAADPRFS